MTEQEKLAREWAEKTWTMGDKWVRAAKDFILANTNPPTMADVQWDNAQHCRQIAVGVNGIKWVMLYQRRDGMILGVRHDLAEVRGLRPDLLTPIRKRYKLVEETISSGEKVGADQPEHPKLLRTLEDYENAPDGTIVAVDVGEPWIKENAREWKRDSAQLRNTDMAGVEREVLRWGWTK